MIREEWQADIVRRDEATAFMLMDRIADYLYPATPMAADRKRQLLADGGDLMMRLQNICDAKVREAGELLAEWAAKPPAEEEE
jgi:hypothetical protein